MDATIKQGQNPNSIKAFKLHLRIHFERKICGCIVKITDSPAQIPDCNCYVPPGFTRCGPNCVAELPLTENFSRKGLHSACPRLTGVV